MDTLIRSGPSPTTWLTKRGVVEPDRRVEAILAICIDAIASFTSYSDELFHTVVATIAERRDQECLIR
jgi:hypothetical protein